jgi:hypothetical protein
MAHKGKLIMAAALAALTFGITDEMTPVPRETPLADSDIVIVKNEAAQPSAQTEESEVDSAKMGKEEGVQTGADQGDKAENDTQKIEQPARRNETTSNLSDEGDNGSQE